MNPHPRCLFLLSLASCLLGGEVYSVRCRNHVCGFHADFEFGGAKGFDQIQGFCTNCEKFVKVSWPRHEPGKQPTPIKYVGSMKLEADRSIYNCPHCSGSFQNICQPRVLHMMICPKCKESHLSYALRRGSGPGNP